MPRPSPRPPITTPAPGGLLSTTLLAVALLVPALLVPSPARARPDNPGSDLFTFDVGDVIETFDTENFRLHYTTDGAHKVPAADNLDGGDGIPDHVQRLADLYEGALATYTGMGFRTPISDNNTPDNGGDGRFDVYLVDFARQADGAYRAERCDGARCSGYMVQENDFAGYNYPSVAVGNATVASHELFHAVQAAYDVDQGAVFSEGTAVWASERFEPSLFDLEGFAYGYLDDAATPLDSLSTGPVDAFTYGAGIFFEYLSERFDDDRVRLLWEAVADDTNPDAFWFDVIDNVLADVDGNFADAFAEFSTWTLFTDDRADPSIAFATGNQMSARTGIAKTLPIEEPSFVLFTASSRLLSFPANTGGSARRAIRVALVGAAEATDGVRAYVYANAILTEVTDQPELDVDITGDGLLLLVNTNAEGRSARPRVCAGSADEVKRCVDAVNPPPEEGPDDDDEKRLSGGGCASTPLGSGGLFGLGLLFWRRRLRR